MVWTLIINTSVFLICFLFWSEVQQVAVSCQCLCRSSALFSVHCLAFLTLWIIYGAPWKLIINFLELRCVYFGWESLLQRNHKFPERRRAEVSGWSGPGEAGRLQSKLWRSSSSIYGLTMWRADGTEYPRVYTKLQGREEHATHSRPVW